jgi:ribosome maturation factor RimP
MLEMDRVQQLIDEIVIEPLFLVEQELSGDDKGRILRLIVDTDAGITVDALAKISRELGRQLDEGEVLPFAYRLEVVSPGLTRALDHPRLLTKAISRKVKVRWTDVENENHESRGVLKSVDETYVIVEHKGQQEKIARENVSRVNYWLEW